MKDFIESSIIHFTTNHFLKLANSNYYCIETQEDERFKKLIMQESIVNIVHYLNHFDRRDICTKDLIILMIQNLCSLCECLGLSRWLAGIIDIIEKEPQSLEVEYNLKFNEAFILQKQLMFCQKIHHSKYAKVSHADPTIKLLKRHLIATIDRLINEYKLYYQIVHQLPFGEFISKYAL